MKTLRLWKLAAWGGVGVMLAGCGTPRRWQPDPLQMAAAATGVADAITFRTTGGPIDADIGLPGQLTLPAAVREGLSNSSEIQMALSRVRAAQADVAQSRLLPNPILSIAVRWPEGGGTPTIEAGLAGDFAALLQRSRHIREAEHRLSAESYQSLVVVLDVLADVQTQYTHVQALDALVPVLEEQLKLSRQLQELAESRLRNGYGTPLDVTVAKTQTLELELEVSQRLAEQRRERLALARLMGRPSDSLDWTLMPWRSPIQLSSSEEEWIGVALRRRPELQSQRYVLAALGDAIELTRLAVLEGGDIGLSAEKEGGWSLGPAMTTPLPLFDWGQARRDKANAQIIEARHELTRIQRDIVQKVRCAHGDYAASMRVLERVAEELVPLQQQRRDQAEAAYKAGQTDMTSLVLANQDLQAAHARRIELERQAAVSAVELQRAVGGLAADQEMTSRTDEFE